MVINCSLRIAPGLSGLVLLFIKILLEESCLKVLLLALCLAADALCSLTIPFISINKLKIFSFCIAYSSKNPKPAYSCMKFKFNWKLAHLNEVTTKVCNCMLAHTATNSKEELIFSFCLEYSFSF